MNLNIIDYASNVNGLSKNSFDAIIKPQPQEDLRYANEANEAQKAEAQT